MKVNVDGVDFGTWLALTERMGAEKPQSLEEERKERQAWLDGIDPIDWAWMTQEEKTG